MVQREASGEWLDPTHMPSEGCRSPVVLKLVRGEVTVIPTCPSRRVRSRTALNAFTRCGLTADGSAGTSHFNSPVLLAARHQSARFPHHYHHQFGSQLLRPAVFPQF